MRYTNPSPDENLDEETILEDSDGESRLNNQRKSIREKIASLFSRGNKNTDRSDLAAELEDAEREEKRVKKSRKILSPAELSAVLTAARHGIEQFPVDAFSPYSAHGVLKSFVSSELSYDLLIVNTIIHEGKRYYLVQQSDKTTGKKGRYALVDDQGRPITIEGEKSGSIGAVFYAHLDKEAKDNVRLQMALDMSFENGKIKFDEIAVTPAPQQEVEDAEFEEVQEDTQDEDDEQEDEEPENTPAPVNNSGEYNKDTPANQALIQQYRPLVKEVVEFIDNDLFMNTNNLTAAQRRNLDLDNEIYFVRLRNALNALLDINGDFYQDLVAAYPSKYANFVYYRDYLEQLWNKRSELKNNNMTIRSNYTTALNQQFRRFFQTMTGERL